MPDPVISEILTDKTLDVADWRAIRDRFESGHSHRPDEGGRQIPADGLASNSIIGTKFNGSGAIQSRHLAVKLLDRYISAVTTYTPAFAATEFLDTTQEIIIPDGSNWIAEIHHQLYGDSTGSMTSLKVNLRFTDRGGGTIDPVGSEQNGGSTGFIRLYHAMFYSHLIPQGGGGGSFKITPRWVKTAGTFSGTAGTLPKRRMTVLLYAYP